jgi:hypothetical protein
MCGLPTYYENPQMVVGIRTVMLAGRQHQVHNERDRKSAAAQQQRQIRRQQGA